MEVIQNIKSWHKLEFCKHGFYNDDLVNDYVPPNMPTGLTLEEEWGHDAHTKRVMWPCAKCGKKFYAHCGLDILGTYGKALGNRRIIADRHLDNGRRQHMVKGSVIKGLVIRNAEITGEDDLKSIEYHTNATH